MHGEPVGRYAAFCVWCIARVAELVVRARSGARLNSPRVVAFGGWDWRGLRGAVFEWWAGMFGVWEGFARGGVRVVRGGALH